MLTNPQLNCKTLGRHYICLFLASALLRCQFLLTAAENKRPPKHPRGPFTLFLNQESYTTPQTAEVGLTLGLALARAVFSAPLPPCPNTGTVRQYDPV